MDRVDQGTKVNDDEDLRSTIDWNFHHRLSGNKATVTGKTAVVEKRTIEHPCFSSGPCLYARIHLPVAPRCNIQCNYCVRKFDCFNESRPGVTSKVLSPDEAFARYVKVRQHLKNLKVVGIAGPGDALANFAETKRTLKLIRACDPEITFCLSTNGLMLPFYAKELVDLGVTHFTITLNAVNVDIGAKIYKFINYFGKRYTGREAATLLLANQLAGLRLLKQYNVVTKVNCVALKGINEHHIPQVIKEIKQLGVYISNIMPHIPIPGSVFQNLSKWKGMEINTLRNSCEVDLRQMRNCRQCRADAVGTLDHDLSMTDLLDGCPTDGARSGACGLTSRRSDGEDRRRLPAIKRFAVATSNGKIVDMHFGEAETFYIYDSDGQTVRLIEKRPVERYCDGLEACGVKQQDKWLGIFKAIGDCTGVLAMKIGDAPMKKLLDKGICPFVTVDTVIHAVMEAAAGQPDQERLSDERKIGGLL